MLQIRLKYLLVVFALCLTVIPVFSQVDDIEKQLYGEVENWNPVYKPVIGVGYGVFNFMGDVKNPSLTPFNGTPGYKVNVSTFLDNNHYIRANFFFLTGSLSGNERSTTNLNRNLNFKSDLLLFGINLNYDFDNLYKTYRKVHPFISVGLETFTFESKTDSFGYENVRYHYWPDGSIRNLPEGSAGSAIIKRDYTYETGLRENDWGVGNYPQYSFGVPIDAGIDFWISDRVLFRVGAAYHFVFTDNIDHVSSKNTRGVIGNKQMDNFMYSYVSLHLDLFSSDKTIKWEKMFADVEWDPTLMGDEDADGYFDGWDNCPNTPFGVETDTLGCPIDSDLDNIPDYLDDEPNSRYGAMVDNQGVELTDDQVIALLDQTNAVARKDIAAYIRTPSSYAGYKRASGKTIPQKFQKIDSNTDGNISFDEMMGAIDRFFDFESELSTDDIYELNEFFFLQ
ncbi:MAG: hypothetical protein JXB34_14620 [Bacteroidales bacterium]|nr:hypothetical protein [Bacteroidales bacterium]